MQGLTLTTDELLLLRDHQALLVSSGWAELGAGVPWYLGTVAEGAPPSFVGPVCACDDEEIAPALAQSIG